MPALFALNQTDASRVADVVVEMQALGAPTIRCVETANGLVAIEGSHRLAAAEELGVEPVIVIIGEDDLVDGNTLNDIQGDVWTAYRYDLADDATAHNFQVTGLQLAEFVDAPSGRFHQFED